MSSEKTIQPLLVTRLQLCREDDLIGEVRCEVDVMGGMGNGSPAYHVDGP